MALVSHMLFYVLLAWFMTTVAVCWISASVSMKRFGPLLRAAIVASVPSMWLIPATLLLTLPEPAFATFGLVMVAVVTWVMAIRTAPRLFAERMVAAMGMAPAVLGALCIQLGIVALWGNSGLLAAALVGCGALVWALSGVARGAEPSRKRHTARHVLLSALLTLLLTTAASTGAFQLAADETEEASLFQTTHSLLVRLAYAPVAPGAAPKAIEKPARRRTEVSAFKSGVPGVVLRPDAKEREQHIFLGVSHSPLMVARTLSFPFTGEYHLFLASSRSLPPDAVVHHGTPLDEAYVANSGGVMETEAWQPLRPPVDFRDCGKILLEISSGERTPASAAIRLVTAGLEIDLENEIFGLDPAARETLEFKMPEWKRSVMVSGIRVLFRRNPSEEDQSTKVRIEQFTLVPVLR